MKTFIPAQTQSSKHRYYRRVTCIYHAVSAQSFPTSLVIS